ncbi:cytochrome c [Aquincola sp. J276]|uniref:c-type cytochrome n=1 Tax=Aquincola sp. J276 TaxID=2898432 RepID=UPI002151FC7E|nr:cytochrome c [Aquincola sp. J276]MCR5863813.1 cytochrome c [Aquincola sp. J276]
MQAKAAKSPRGRWLRRGAAGLGIVVLLAAAAATAGHVMAGQRMKRQVAVPPQPAPAWRSDAAAVDRGRYLYASRGCVDCHGADGAGRTFLDEPGGLKVVGPNITPDAGSAVAGYRPQDWARTLRHGVKPDGTPVLIMPSEDYNRLTDDDLSALVAYVRQLPARPGASAVVSLPLPVRVLYGFGAIPDAAAKIDHTLPPPMPVPEGVTREHGAYVANMCLGCHGARLTGGKVPGGPPDWPAAADLTGGDAGGMAAYADADALLKMFRTGRRPDGTPVKVMPFESLREMSETDVRALHLFLRGLPAGGAAAGQAGAPVTPKAQARG